MEARCIRTHHTSPTLNGGFRSNQTKSPLPSLRPTSMLTTPPCIQDRGQSALFLLGCHRLLQSFLIFLLTSLIFFLSTYFFFAPPDLLFSKTFCLLYLPTAPTLSLDVVIFFHTSSTSTFCLLCLLTATLPAHRAFPLKPSLPTFRLLCISIATLSAHCAFPLQSSLPIVPSASMPRKTTSAFLHQTCQAHGRQWLKSVEQGPSLPWIFHPLMLSRCGSSFFGVSRWCSRDPS